MEIDMWDYKESGNDLFRYLPVEPKNHNSQYMAESMNAPAWSSLAFEYCTEQLRCDVSTGEGSCDDSGSFYHGPG